MHGNSAQLKEKVKSWLVEVPLNELEDTLLEKFLDEPSESAEKITDLLTKVKKKLQGTDNKRALKQLNRVLPLFERHEFWSTQPVIRVTDPTSQFNVPVEEKTLADVNTSPLPLPESYEWC